MENFKISIIVPVYNAAEYINKCLDSLIGQTYTNIEIICVNDESKDNSLEILESYAKKDSRVRVISLKNNGVSNARNEALEVAAGDGIVFVDSDDWLEVSACEVAYQEMKRTDADIVMFPYIKEFGTTSEKKRIYSENKIFEGEDLKKLHIRFAGPMKNELKSPENSDALCTVWGKLYKKEVIEGIEFYDIRKIGSFEDGLFNLNVFGRVKKVSYINKYLYHYRKNNTSSLTTGYKPNLLSYRQNIYEQINKYIRENSLDKTYERALKNRIVFEIIYLGLNEFSNKECSVFERVKNIKNIINAKSYRQAAKKFTLKTLPIHWKIFFTFAKYNCAQGIYYMIALIKIIRKRRR